MNFEQYIEPELLILIPVLYGIGMMFKRSEIIPDKHIPIIIGGIGVLLATMYVIGLNGLCVESVFTGIVQGVLCASASVYAHQAYKQLTKDK